MGCAREIAGIRISFSPSRDAMNEEGGGKGGKEKEEEERNNIECLKLRYTRPKHGYLLGLELLCLLLVSSY